MVLREAYLTPATPADNIDSPAIWHGPDGQSWILATGKESHQLRVYDAATGRTIGTLGRPGSGRGDLLRPNGVLVVDDIALVVERDNHRVQAFRLPGGEPLGWFGETTLRKPYGLAAVPTSAGEWDVYVTDAYTLPDEQLPPPAQLGERIKHFRVRIRGDTVTANLIRAFGATSGAGVLAQVESIQADPVERRLLIADEHAVDVKVYTLDGEYTGQTLGGEFLNTEPEGIALYTCGTRAGYWILTDQSSTGNTFHLLDRRSLRRLGSFRGGVITNTDGIVLTQRPVGRWADGVFFAVHDDQAVAALPWAEISGALRLRSHC